MFSKRPEIQTEPESPLAWLRWVPAAILTVVVLYLLYVMACVAIVPILASFGLAYLLDPLAKFGQRRGLSRSVASLVAITLIGVGLLALMSYVLPQLWGETSKAVTRLAQRFTPEHGKRQRALLKRYSPPLESVAGETVEKFFSDPANLLSRVTASPPVADAATQSGGQVLLTALGSSLDLMLVPFFVYYLLVDFRRWRGYGEELIPPRYRDSLSRLFDESGRILESYVRGQILIGAIMSICYALGFAALGVPAWAGIALIAGMLNAVPYVGTVIGMVLACAFTLASGAAVWKVGPVLLVFLAVQTLEGYVLTPKILGGRLNLHPMAVFLGLLIGGKLFGLWGVILAIPVIAVAKVFLKFAKELYQGSGFYRGPVAAHEAPVTLEERVADAADTVSAEQVEGSQESEPSEAPQRPSGSSAPEEPS